MRILILSYLILISSCAHKSKYVSIEKQSWDKLYTALQFSGEGRLQVTFGDERKHSFSFESLLEQEKFLIEVSKALYGSELLTLSFRHKKFQGKILRGLRKRLTVSDYKKLRRMATLLAHLLEVHAKQKCQSRKCYISKLGEGWTIERLETGVDIRYKHSDYIFTLAADRYEQQRFSKVSIALESGSQRLEFLFYFSPN